MPLDLVGAEAKRPAPLAYAHTLDNTGRILGGLSRSTVKRLCARGELQSIKIAGRRLVTDESLRALIERSRAA